MATLLTIAVAACAGPSPLESVSQRPARVETGSRSASLDAQRSYAIRLLASIDAERARAGLAPLRVAACVQRPAERWAGRLAAGEALRHQNLTPITRICRAQRVGEIVGATTRGPDVLVDAWLASRRHRKTLLAPYFTHVGIGIEQARSGRWFAVVAFAAF